MCQPLCQVLKIQQKTGQIRFLLVQSLQTSTIDSQNVRVLRGPRDHLTVATQSVVCGPGSPASPENLTEMQKLRSHPRPADRTLPTHRIPGDSSAQSEESSEKPSLALRGVQQILHPGPTPVRSLHEHLSHGDLFRASAASPFMMSSANKLFFLCLNGNLLLYKFHTPGLVLTLGQSKAHTFFFHLISLVIQRLSVLISRLNTSRCYSHSLYSFIHPLSIYLLVRTRSSH